MWSRIITPSTHFSHSLPQFIGSNLSIFSLVVPPFLFVLAMFLGCNTWILRASRPKFFRTSNPRFIASLFSGLLASIGTDPVMNRVLSALKQLKIFDTIISNIAVNMMYDLVVRQLSPKMLLHKISMLSDSLSIYSNNFVRIISIHTPDYNWITGGRQCGILNGS